MFDIKSIWGSHGIHRSHPSLVKMRVAVSCLLLVLTTQNIDAGLYRRYYGYPTSVACSVSDQISSCTCDAYTPCPHPNTECSSMGTCQCKDGFESRDDGRVCGCGSGLTLNSAGDSCIISEVGDDSNRGGSDCSAPVNSKACEGILSAFCPSTDKKCRCNAGFMRSDDRRSCICEDGKSLNAAGTSCEDAEVGDDSDRDGSDCSGPTSSRACVIILFASCPSSDKKCRCNTGFVSSADSQSCVCEVGKSLNAAGNSCEDAAVGDDSNRDGSDCSGPTSSRACVNTPFASCPSLDKKCKCDTSFVSTADSQSCVCEDGKTLEGDVCVDAEIGDSCNAPVSENACNNIRLSVCGNDDTCQCTGGSVPSFDGRSCVCAIGMTLNSAEDGCVESEVGDDDNNDGSDCSSPVNSRACDGIPFASCPADEKCRCDAGFVRTADRQSCVCEDGKSLNSAGTSCEEAEVGDDSDRDGSDCSGPTSSRACVNIPFASCPSSDKKCKCDIGFVSSADSQSCVCEDGKSLNAAGTSCEDAEVGDDSDRDGSDCSGPTSSRACINIPFASCPSSDRKCRCDTTFVSSADRQSCVCEDGKTLEGDVCVDAEIGDSCNAPVSENACNNIELAVCGDDDTCQCTGGSVPSFDGRSCVCGIDMTLNSAGDGCVESEVGDDDNNDGSDCSSPVNSRACDGITFASCPADEKCKCDTGFVRTSDRQSCVCEEGKSLNAAGTSCEDAEVGDDSDRDGSDCSGPTSSRACVNIPFASCPSLDKKCKCDTGFVSTADGQSCVCEEGKTLDGKVCVDAEIGDSCSAPVSENACNCIELAVCGAGETCQCTGGSVPSSASSDSSGSSKHFHRFSKHLRKHLKKHRDFSESSGSSGHSSELSQSSVDGTICVCGDRMTLNSAGDGCVPAEVGDDDNDDGSDCSGPFNSQACDGIPFASCPADQKCRCNPGFLRTSDRQSCVCENGKSLNAAGTTCEDAEVGDDSNRDGSDCSGPTSSRACENTPFASCPSLDKKCKCNTGFVSSDDSQSCACDDGKTLRGDVCVDAKIGDRCNAPVSENACNNIELAVCGDDDTCQCTGASVPSSDGGSCVCGIDMTLNSAGDGCVESEVGDDDNNDGSDCGGPVNSRACDAIPFASCPADEKCRCDTGFVRTADRQSCVCEDGKSLNAAGTSCEEAEVGDDSNRAGSDCSGPTSSRACVNTPFASCPSSDKKCKCDSGFVSSADSQSCVCEVGKSLNDAGNSCEDAEVGDDSNRDGSDCSGPTSSRACVNTPFASCPSSDKKCKCDTGFMTTADSQSCVCEEGKTLKGNDCVVAEVGDSCESPVSAAACALLANASCDSSSEKCECNSGFIVSSGGTCDKIYYSYY